MLSAAARAQAFALRRIPRKAHTTPFTIRAAPQRRSFTRSAVCWHAQDLAPSTASEGSWEILLENLSTNHPPIIESRKVRRNRKPRRQQSTPPVQYEGQRLIPANILNYEAAREIAWSLPDAHSSITTSVDDTVWRLQQAVQTNDVLAAYGLLQSLTSQFHVHDAAEAISKLPRMTISSIFAALDPLSARVLLDPTDGLNIPETLQEYSSVGTAFDEYGVRKVWRVLFAHMEMLVEILDVAQISLLPSEYCVLIRCAGATSDARAAKRVWALMETERAPPSEIRTAALYNEFLSARYLSRSLYRQYDRNRSRFRPRNVVMSRYTNTASRKRKDWLEELRLDAARKRRFMYGVTPRKPLQDLHWTLSSPMPFQRISRSMHEQGIVVDTRLLNTSMKVNGVTGRLYAIYRMIEREFELKILNGRDHDLVTFHFKRRKASERRPLQPAPLIVETTAKTLASLGLVSFAVRFMDAISSQHRWTFSPIFWSKFLSCTHMLARPKARQEWEAFSARGNANHLVSDEDVIAIFETMTAAPNNVEPNFEDHSSYVRALIAVERFDDARCEIRRGVAYYRNVVKDVSQALLIRLHPSPPPSAHQAFLRAKALQHTSWYEIMKWCQMWIWRISRGIFADPAIAERKIPDFMLEFSDFMAHPTKYKTQSGLVHIKTSEFNHKARWTKQIVRSTPTTALRHQESLPVLDGEGNHKTGSNGQLLYRKGPEIFWRLEERFVRVRKPQRWEGFGPDAKFVEQTRDGDETSFGVCQDLVVDSIEW